MLPNFELKILFGIFFISMIFIVNLYSQTKVDWEKWDKAQIDYKKTDNSRNRDYSFESDNPGEFILKSFANGYWFFISDVDGDNCPFRPSCSAFLLHAVKETNILQGSLMFFDRFTRDINIFKKGNYPKVPAGRYYDPVNLYTLSEEKINFIPPNKIVAFE